MRKIRLVCLIVTAAFIFNGVFAGIGFAEKVVMDGQDNINSEVGTTADKPVGFGKGHIKERAEQHKQKRNELKLKMKGNCLDIEIDEETEIELETNELLNGDETVTQEVYRERRQEGLRKIATRLRQNIHNASQNEKLKLAIVLMKTEKNDEALKIVKDIINKNPEDQKALVTIAKIYREMKDYKKAIETIEDIIEKFPHSRVKAFLGILHGENGELDRAREMLEIAIKEEHKARELYKELGRIYQKQERKGYKVFVKGNKPEFDVEPVAHNNRILVPIRAIAEALGVVVTYNPEDKSITMNSDDTEIVMWIGSDKALVNGKEVELDVKPLVVNNRTLVPIRFISEAFDTDVSYDSETQLVIIEEKGDTDEE